jgi:general secretion pathway protein D
MRHLRWFRSRKNKLCLSCVLGASLATLPLPAQDAAAPPQATQNAATQARTEALAKAPTAKDKSRAAKLYAKGLKAMDANDPRQAAEAFSQAAELDPSNRDYPGAAEVARQHLLTQLVQEAAKARLAGQDDVARAKLAEALKIDPHNLVVTQHMAELADMVGGSAVASPYTATEYSNTVLAPSTARRDFHVRTNSKELLRQIFTAYGLTVMIDDSVRPQAVRMDADGLGFRKAAELANLLTRTFYVPVDPTRVLIAADTKENRQKYEREYEETVYLPGMTPTELSDIGNVVKNIFDAQQSIVQPAAGTVTLRAPEPTLRAVNRMIAGLTGGKGQVLLDVRIYEIGKLRARNIGIQLPQQVTIFNVPTEVSKILSENQSLVNQIITSGLANPGDYATIAAILIASGAITGGILTEPFAVFGGGTTLEGVTLGTATVNLSLNTSDSRMLDQIQLRAGDQDAATLRSGTRYPIITSIYSASTIGSNIPGLTSPGLSSTLANLGINLPTSAAPTVTPQIQYEDLGLTLKATPRIQRSKEITLSLDMKVEALGNGQFNGLPVLNNRVFTGTITVPEGKTAVLVSGLSRQESRAVSGIPGFSEIPGFRSTTNVDAQLDVSNLMVMITPHLVRMRGTDSADPMVMLPKH